MKKSVIINAIKKFFDESQKNNITRHFSWDYCYKQFHDAKMHDNHDDGYIDYLALNLTTYLASTGMYQGSSFLLKKDYKLHSPVVKEILKPNYNALLNLNVKDFNSNEATLKILTDFITGYYAEQRSQVKESEERHKFSPALAPKILLGTLGCAPAYDKYFVVGIRKDNIATGTFSLSSLNGLTEFYEKNYEPFEEIRYNLKVKDTDIEYPQMRLLDIAFTQIGFDLDKKSK